MCVILISRSIWWCVPCASPLFDPEIALACPVHYRAPYQTAIIYILAMDPPSLQGLRIFFALPPIAQVPYTCHGERIQHPQREGL